MGKWNLLYPCLHGSIYLIDLVTKLRKEMQELKVKMSVEVAEDIA